MNNNILGQQMDKTKIMQTTRQVLFKSKRFAKNVGFANMTFFALLGFALSIKLFKQHEEHEVPYYKWRIFHRVKPTETVFERPY